MKFDYLFSAEAEADLDDILAWSHEQFGPAIREAYEALVFAGIADIATDPTRVGAHPRPELGDTVMTWHLARSRTHVGEGARRIASPRHFIAY